MTMGPAWSGSSAPALAALRVLGRANCTELHGPAADVQKMTSRLLWSNL